MILYRCQTKCVVVGGIYLSTALLTRSDGSVRCRRARLVATEIAFPTWKARKAPLFIGSLVAERPRGDDRKSEDSAIVCRKLCAESRKNHKLCSMEVSEEYAG